MLHIRLGAILLTNGGAEVLENVLGIGSDAIDEYLSNRDEPCDTYSDIDEEQAKRLYEATKVLENVFQNNAKVETHFDDPDIITRDIGGQVFIKRKGYAVGFYDVTRKASVLKFLENIDQMAISSEEDSDEILLSIDWRVNDVRL